MASVLHGSEAVPGLLHMHPQVEDMLQIPNGDDHGQDASACRMVSSNN